MTLTAACMRVCEGRVEFWRLTAPTKPKHIQAGLVDYCGSCNPVPVKSAALPRVLYRRGLVGDVQVYIFGLVEAVAA
ncbi:hypothetical protein BM221_008957 [Beauveria bassiana]|uniref:Uncharacterized protein n=1 Tax=Beauveria bassiana TaxID=176275 RepID=A0A2N6NEE0_BEABA|nr:hypothetical protein BM221_008957 [Beauveria bassiana]